MEVPGPRVPSSTPLPSSLNSDTIMTAVAPCSSRPLIVGPWFAVAAGRMRHRIGRRDFPVHSQEKEA